MVRSARPDATGRGLPVVPGYEVLSVLGRGGMGVVYLARQVRLNRPCALKMVLAGGHATPEALARFFAEAEAVAGLRHPNVVQIFYLGEAGGLPFFEMEYLEGGSLAQSLDGSPWTPARAARMIGTLARAVAEAHRLRIIHRDLKPANILLAADGSPKVSDFGLAKRMGPEVGLTGTDMVLGSPSYMAPEQAEGHARQVGPPADVYALGAILYELLTGRPPFRGATPIETIHQVLTAEPVPPSRLVPNLPRDIETIALKCLEKSPPRRYPEAAGLADELDRFLAGKPIAARSVGPAERAWRWCGRNPTVAGLLALLMTVLLAGFAGMTILWIRAESLRERSDGLNLLSEDRRRDAEQLRQVAEARTAEVIRQRESLRAGREATRRLNYFAEMHLAHQNWSEDRGISRMRELLAHWSDPGEQDLRGWEWYYLDGLLHQEMEVLPTGQSERAAVAWSPDGASLAAAGEAFTIRVWASSHRETPAASLAGHTGPVAALTWSPDSRLLATASADRTVRVWDRAGGFASVVLKARVPLAAVAWSPDGARITAAGDDGDILVWSPGGGESRLLFRAPAPLNLLAWSPDGEHLAGGDKDGVLQVWDADGRSPATLTASGGDRGEVLSIDWAPGGSRLAVGESSRVVRLWDVSTKKELRVLRGHTRAVEGVRWSGDGTRLASASADNLVKVWDPATGAEMRTLRGHDLAVHSVAWGPDGRLASAGVDATVRIWDVAKDTEVAVGRGSPGGLYAIAWSPDGRTVAAAGEDGSIGLFDPEAARLRSVLRGGARSRVLGLAWSPDGTRIASSSRDGRLRVWAVGAGTMAREFRPHVGPAMAIAWSPDGTRLASAGHDASVQIRDVRTGARLLRLLHGRPVNDVRWSPDGTRLVTGVRDGTVRLWSADDGRPLLVIRHGEEVKGVGWSPDGTRLASGGIDRLIRIWDAATGREITALRGHTDWCYSVSWNREGSRLASAGADRVVRVWDPGSGQETLILRGSSEICDSAAWSPDGIRLAAACRDGTIRIWDASSGHARKAPPRSGGPDPNGR